MNNAEFKRAQTFYDRASELRQILENCEFESGNSTPGVVASILNKFGIGGDRFSPAGKMNTAKDNVLVQLQKFMANFPDYTYKISELPESPNIVHVAVKFDEAGSAFMFDNKDPMIQTQYRRIGNYLEKFMTLNPSVKGPKVKEGEEPTL